MDPEKFELTPDQKRFVEQTAQVLAQAIVAQAMHLVQQTQQSAALMTMAIQKRALDETEIRTQRYNP